MTQLYAYEALTEAAWRSVSGLAPVPFRRVRSKFTPVVRRSLTRVLTPTTVPVLLPASLLLNCSSE